MYIVYFHDTMKNIIIRFLFINRWKSTAHAQFSIARKIIHIDYDCTRFTHDDLWSGSEIVPFQQFGIRENSLQSLPSNWNMQYYRKIAVISFSPAKPRSISRVPREMPLFAGNYGIYRRKVRKERGEEIRQNEKCARGKNEKKSV